MGDQIGDFILCFKSKFCDGDKRANNSMNELDETRIVGDRVSGGMRLPKLKEEMKHKSSSHHHHTSKSYRPIVTSNWEYPSEEDYQKRYEEEINKYKKEIPEIYDERKTYDMHTEWKNGQR